MTRQRGSQVQRDYFWNTAASVMSAGSSMLLLMVVTQFMGADAGGIYALAYALAWQFQTLGAFEMRPYQATDVQRRYSFGTYHASRIVTVGLMVTGVVGYALVSRGFTDEALLVILVAFLRVFDAYEDVFHGEFQRIGKLDLGARACFFRVLTTTAVFTVSVAISRDLLVACVATLVASTVAILWLNIPVARRLYGLHPTFSWQPIGKLLLACLPLFIGAFLAIYVTNAPKFGIDQHLPLADQAYYNALFVPAMMINLLAGLAFKPMLTALAASWNGNNRSAFTATIRRGLYAIALASVAVLIGGFFIGIPLLSFLYRLDLAAFRPELMILIVGGVLNALSILFYYVLVTMRLQRLTMWGYALAAILAFALSSALIPDRGLQGASLAYTGSVGVLAAFWLVFIVLKMKQTPRSQVVAPTVDPESPASR